MSCSCKSTVSISNGAFSVEVVAVGVQPIYKHGDFVYVPIPHNTEFMLRLRSGWRTKARAEVTVDGESAGAFRVEAWDKTEIERPTHTQKNFTYWEEATAEFGEAKGEAKAKENGVVEIVFKPEKDAGWGCDRGCVVADSAKKTKGMKARGFGMDESGHDGSYPLERSFGIGTRGVAATSSASSTGDLNLVNLFGSPSLMPIMPPSALLGGAPSVPASTGTARPAAMSLGGNSLDQLFNAPAPAAAPSFTHGMIGLGSRSNQTFVTVPAITNIDTARITKIVFRFVTAKPEPRYESMASAAQRAGVPTKSMSVPPRFDGSE